MEQSKPDVQYESVEESEADEVIEQKINSVLEKNEPVEALKKNDSAVEEKRNQQWNNWSLTNQQTNRSCWQILLQKLLVDTITEAVGRNHHLKGKE
ncbi:hypothetical protein F511_04864 [Dorcoceras hygrometricum]|uniref:Uncharacterized protein n=1 Tax=Dorcoceras hygrometricum TaxID=472368 RepID=A0A2Z7DE61_9LAMI|nr:hypothetical protein F511_04864 [Dorcoceras hygrometricum]